ncbi:MAG TPA: protein kinase, partial [Urbifossiella sp.]
MSPSVHPEPDVLAAFSRGQVPSAERRAIAEHVHSCDSCAAVLQQFRQETLTGRSPESETPSHLQHTNLAQPVSDANFAPPGSIFFPRVPPALADHPQYRIIDRLGEGGMGVVYKAEHRMMGRVVALKVLAPHLTVEPEAVDRFLKEVSAAGKLSHPNIVISHDAGEAGGLHFLVMEFVEGISLDRLVQRRGPLAPTMASHFARQVALGLQHAFEKGMVHRDIKPQNLMVTRKGQVKILDFGLARLGLDAEGTVVSRNPPATAADLIMGTPDYLSPEQAKNSHTVDIRSDLYSLGCSLYFLLTGRAPFSRATTLIDKLLAHTEEQPEPLAAHRLDVPDGLMLVLAKLMAKRPEDRYATPAEAAAALAPYARGIDATPPPAATLPNKPAPAGYEVMEASAEKPTISLIGPAINEFLFESETAEQASLPEKKPKKKKRRKSFWERRRKLIIGIAAAFLGVLIVAGTVKKFRKPSSSETALETAASTNSPPAPGPNSPGATVPSSQLVPKFQPNVLFVLPSFELAVEEYQPVRQRLERAGARIYTSSAPPAFHGKYPVKLDYALRPELDVSRISALIFV